MAIGYIHDTTQKVKTVGYEAGTDVVIDLPIGNVVYLTMLKLSYTYTIGATQSSVSSANALKLIKGLEIELDGKDRVVDLDADGLYSFARLDTGQQPGGYANLKSVVGDTGTVCIDLPIMHFIPGMQSGDAAALDLRGLNEATMRIRWADGLKEALIDPTGSTVDNVSLTVTQKVTKNVPGGDNGVSRLAVREMRKTRRIVEHDDDQFRITLPRREGKHLQRMHLIQQRDDRYTGASTVEGANRSIIIGDIMVYAGAQTFHRGDWETFNAEFSIMRNTTLPVNYVPISTSLFGQPTKTIDMNALDGDLTIECEVSGADDGQKAELTLYTSAIRPPRVDRVAV